MSIAMISQTGGHGDYWVPAGAHPQTDLASDGVADGVEV